MSDKEDYRLIYATDETCERNETRGSCLKGNILRWYRLIWSGLGESGRCVDLEDKFLHFTIQGPSCKQILITFSGPFVTCDLGVFLARACDALDAAKIKLTLLAMTTAYGAYSISTAEVPHPATLDVIRGFAMQIFKTDTMYIGLPTSTSYICIINVPFFEDNACTQRVSLDRIKGALACSLLHEHFILARDPRFVRNSSNSTNCTVNIDLWDSQTGALLESPDRVTLEKNDQTWD